MGGADAENQDKNASPDEHLEWHNIHDEVAAAVSPIVSRRGKKRARSSSPVSSPAVDKRKPPAVNVAKLKQALKSPHADPALDLWNRFAVGGPESKNPTGAANPVLAHLMVSSSPRPPKDAKEGGSSHGESGLRRAISCGTHWPKRRRVESTSEPGLGRERRDTSKSSMVTALLETVNSEINKSDAWDQGDVGIESPSIKRRRSPKKTNAEPSGLPQLPEASSPAARTGQTQKMNYKDAISPTSDYDDDEFDDNALWEIDASLLSGQVEAGSFMAADKALAGANAKEPRQEQGASSDDEFGDVDDDLLAAAEDMIADITPKRASNPEPPAPAKAVHPVGGMDDSDDIYGDDFGGDFDFEAAELAATQSVGQTTSSLMPVRSVR